MNRIFIILFFIFFPLFTFALDISDDILVEKIANILIKEYDNYKDKNFMEKTILKLGKPAFIDNVKIWEKNYKNINQINIKLHPKIEDILYISEKYLTYDENLDFRKNFESLTLLAYKNLQIYYIALKDFLKDNPSTEINIKTIDDSLTDIKYYDEKTKLYESEAEIKSNIRYYFNNKKIKYKVSFYAFVFEFFDDIRKKIIKKDMEKMLQKINFKNQKN